MPEPNLIHAFKEFSTQHGLVRPSDSIVVAVSGGLDSVVLLDLLTRVREEWNLRLVIGHFNHQLRGPESDGDESFVRSLGLKYQIECYVERADTHSAAEHERRSVQETARNLRYRFLTGLRSSLEFRAIVTAHHANDNLETILFNLLRGTGLHGMTGIPLQRDDEMILRPMLFATREQIISYADKCELEHREDSTNEKTDYARNFIRHTILPLVRERINPNVAATVGRTAEIFQNLEQYIASQVQQLMPELIVEQSVQRVVIDRQKLMALPIFLQETILRDLVAEIVRSEADFLTVRALLNVSKGESGTTYPFPDNIVFSRDRERLIFHRNGGHAKFEHRIEIGREYEFAGFRFRSSFAEKAEFQKDPSIEFLDADKVHAPFVLRSWQPGDRFIPFGMRAEKKLSDFFIDEKVSNFDKDAIPLFESGGVIAWVCGRRLDDRFKVTETTRNILKLEYITKL